MAAPLAQLGYRVRFADGSFGQIVALRRVLVDSDVKTEIVVGPDEGVQVMPPDDIELTIRWIDLDSVTLFVPIDFDAAETKLQSELTDAKLALLNAQLAERLDTIGTASPIDVALRALLDAVPLVTGLPIPPSIADAFTRAAHAVIKAVAP